MPEILHLPTPMDLDHPVSGLGDVVDTSNVLAPSAEYSLIPFLVAVSYLPPREELESDDEMILDPDANMDVDVTLVNGDEGEENQEEDDTFVIGSLEGERGDNGGAQ
ncbi:hypothetical protein B0H13DRAFT_2302373 [Mycena leptocephala]|nr:hypothetical protein B0H13DRAFT_2302373 [Mycena leptocephala]